jgi:hypothetical protein
MVSFEKAILDMDEFFYGEDDEQVRNSSQA